MGFFHDNRFVVFLKSSNGGMVRRVNLFILVFLLNMAIMTYLKLFQFFVGACRPNRTAMLIPGAAL